MYYKFVSKIYERAAEKMCQEMKSFVKEGEKILDLGCGTGILAKKIEEILKAKILGIDIVDRRLTNISFQIFDGKNIPFSNNSFDNVLISFVLHHTENPEEILKEAKRVGKKIIIFEDLPKGILGKIRCYLHLFSWNLFFDKNKKFNFFSEREWERIFEKLKLKLILKKDFLAPFSFLDPVKKKMFVLKV